MRSRTLAAASATLAGLVCLSALVADASASAGTTTGENQGITADLAAGSKTTPTEARRVDGLKVDLGMHQCLTQDQAAAEAAKAKAEITDPRQLQISLNVIDRYTRSQCGTATVPMDYDNPRGATTKVPVLLRPAKDPAKRKGALFMNPGGPGGSGVDLALFGDSFLSKSVTDAFDIVAVEPRLVGVGPIQTCYPTAAEHDAMQKRYAGAFEDAYPVTGKEWSDFYEVSFEIGRACRENAPLMSHATTAEEARDMEVVRQALKVDKMSFFGFSYGTEIAQTYGNMFPDRMRALLADGVVEADDWAGTYQPSTNLDRRLHDAEGAELALKTILARCDAAGPEKCVAAKQDDKDITAAQKWAFISAELTKKPYEVQSPDGVVKFTLPTVQSQIQGLLYQMDATGESVAQTIMQFYPLLKARADGTDLPGDEATQLQTAILQRRAATIAKLEAVSGTREEPTYRDVEGAPWRGQWPAPAYRDGSEQYSTVTCGDGRHPLSQLDGMKQAEEAGRENPNFGQLWAWSSAQCSAKAWLAQDAGHFRGPFTKQTAQPMLFVGDTYDPATNKQQAIKSAKRQPGSLLVTSESWGHTAYGSSKCTTDAVDAYLLDPSKGYNAQCVGDYQPFQDAPAPGGRTQTEVDGDTEAVPTREELVSGLGAGTVAQVLRHG